MYVIGYDDTKVVVWDWRDNRPLGVAVARGAAPRVCDIAGLARTALGQLTASALDWARVDTLVTSGITLIGRKRAFMKVREQWIQLGGKVVEWPSMYCPAAAYTFMEVDYGGC